MLITVVFLSIFLIASIIGNIILFKIAENIRDLNEVNEKRIIDIKDLTNKVYGDIKFLDDKEIFAKDDEVGVVFKEMVDVVKFFNEIVQNDEEVEITEREIVKER
jgi:hypothetical protein